MKKLLVFLTAGVLVCSIQLACLAEVTTSADLKVLWNYEKTGVSDSKDGGELKIKLDGKLENDITTRIVLKTVLDSNDTTGDRSKPSPYIDEYYVKYPLGKAAQLQFGKWGFKSKGLVDIIDTVYGDFKAEWALQGTYKFSNGFNAALWVAANRSNISEVVGDGAFVATAGWSNQLISIDVNVIDSGDEASILKLSTGKDATNTKQDDQDGDGSYDTVLNKKAQRLKSSNGEGTKLGYTANLRLNLSDNFIPFLYYGENDLKGYYKDQALILGSRMKFDALEVTLEYNFDNDFFDGTTPYLDKDNAYGAKIKYTFKNSMNVEYKYYNYGWGKSGYGNKEKSELALNIPIK